MAGAESARRLDGGRQPHQRADDGDAVADQGGGEEGCDGEEEDGEEFLVDIEDDKEWELVVEAYEKLVD